jgi:aminoglycoside 6'-N-acetyltransferase I
MNERGGGVAGGNVRLAKIEDWGALAQMRSQLWPDGSAEEHERELRAILSGEASGNAEMTIFVWEGRDGSLAGFLEARLRSHADGCDEAQSVGYVEGWFVREEYRRRGIGAELLRAAEDWARGQGCKEMASDAEIENYLSQRTHEALGFRAGSRVVTYRKAL